MRIGMTTPTNIAGWLEHARVELSRKLERDLTKTPLELHLLEHGFPIWWAELERVLLDGWELRQSARRDLVVEQPRREQ